MRVPAVYFLFVAALLAGAGCSAVYRHTPLSREPAPSAESVKQAESEFHRGQELVLAGQYEEALTAIFPQARVFERAEQPARAAEALFWTGYCHEKLGRWADAASFYRLVTAKYPDTPAARESAKRLKQKEKSAEAP